MAHPALLAIPRQDGRFDWYEWPDGGYAVGPDRPRPEPASGDLDRITTGLSMDDAIESVLDVGRHEALLVDGSDPRAFRVLRFAVPTSAGVLDTPSRGDTGALVAVDDVADPEPDGYVRGWYEATRACVGEAIDRGVLDPVLLSDELRDRVARFAGDDVSVIHVSSE